MTKDELSQIYYLNCELEELQRRISELEKLQFSENMKITGLTKTVNGCQDTNIRTELLDLRELLDLNLKKCLLEIGKATQFIQSIDDSQMRLILTFRYINRLTWQQIAFRIGESDEQYPRKKHNTFLRNLNWTKKTN